MDRQSAHRHIQRIVHNAASYDLPQGCSPSLNQGPGERDPSEWRFGPGPGLKQQQQQQQPTQEPVGFGNKFGLDLGHTSQLMAAPSNNFGLDLSDTSQSMAAPSTNRTRLTFPPRSMHSQPEPQPASELRTLSNADNHFRFAQNLRNGVALNQALSRQKNVLSGDPISPLVNAMLTQQRMPLRQQIEQNIHQDMPFSQGHSDLDSLMSMDSNGELDHDMLMQSSMGQRQHNFGQPNFYQGLHSSNRLNQLQPQRQQATPPFNLSGFVHSPAVAQGSRSSSPLVGQGSSPTARISLRRASNRSAPKPRYPQIETNMDADTIDAENYNYPQTPQQRTLNPTTKYTPRPLALSHAPPIAHGIQLVSPQELPDRFRQVFPYELFNAAQSKCFAPIYKTDDNVVVSAPTGSGKTALLELAICRVVEGYSTGQFKIVYLAPTKSLCSERMRDWSKKFSHLNLPCAELTGDTSQAEMARVRNATIIVTTPEKWDSITRKWSDHQKLVQMVKLFLIDEVHILKDTRGATLEAVVSRMKTIGANVRFVALSATVPNSEDIATWLGRDHTNHQIPAHREIFGEEFRPVKLQKHVHGFDGNFNEFAFEKVLDGKLPNLIKQYSQKKPIMVFCFTRKSCEGTAIMMAEWWTRQKFSDRAWSQPSQTVPVSSRELRELVSCGVAYHHAGLDPQDRAAVENAFLRGDVNIICCTSTLAVGVNLPCHLVVLKGTVGFQDGRLTEYSDLEVMQMLGRAGRPQFDDSAVAVIMTRSDKVDRYKKMMSGQDVLESTLHLNLIEHLNSEISLGTIKNTYDAKKWLCGTFLSVRMRQNPNYYKIDGVTPGGDADSRLEQVCERDIKLLQENQLVTVNDRISCTEYGAAMSRYMVQFETMKLLLSIPPHAKTEQILHILCQATEFKDLRMKPAERPILREFNKSPFIKFPIKEIITTTPHKVSLLIQVQLGGIDYPTDKGFIAVKRQFGTDKSIIFERIQRLIRCVIDCKAHDGDSISTRHALDLARSLSAEFWEYSNLQLRQIPQIGPVATRKLVSNNIHSVEELENLDTGSIERIISKNPPFGKKTRDSIAGFPRLRVAAEIVGRVLVKQNKTPRVHVKARMWYSNAQIPVWQGKRPSLTFMAETTDGKIFHFWRGNVSKLEKDFNIKFSVDLLSPDVNIKCWIACDEIVGTVKSFILKHEIPSSEFPPASAPEGASKETQPSHERAPLKDADEFGNDDVEDDDMLAAVTGVDTSPPRVETQPQADREKNDGYGSEDFIDIEEAEMLSKAATVEKTKKNKVTKEPEFHEPFQMANGKWTCNHICRDGKLLKNGKSCKHLCCREGLDKPRKAKRKASLAGIGEEASASKTSETATTGGGKPEKKKTSSGAGSAKPRALQNSQPKLKLSSNHDDSDLEDVEIINLADVLSPVSYSKMAPRDYRKLHELHTSIQPDKASQRLTQKPKFSYADGISPDLPFLNNGQASISKPSDSVQGKYHNEFPSPTALLRGLDEKEFFDIGSDDDPFTEVPITPRDLISAASRNLGTTPNQPTSYPDLPRDATGIAPLSLPEPISVKPSTPKVASSFYNDVFDFAAFENDVDIVSNPASPSADKQQHQVSSSGSGINRAKRPLSAYSSPETKHRRVTHVTPAKISNASVVPDWVNDFDASLIDGLKGFVDFVD
ncbi:hypothetical protein LZ554_003579 [Drepanopeziza brunnea f. sp. 'monogermtubi']|nr:hypothetical protein LZ554_003579 [Drepanopeziza brunnea f. sp. 'monogermtubi']